jgi:hypothetical protein
VYLQGATPGIEGSYVEAEDQTSILEQVGMQRQWMAKPVDLKVRPDGRRMRLLKSLRKHGECAGNVVDEQRKSVCLARLTEECHRRIYRGQGGF